MSFQQQSPGFGAERLAFGALYQVEETGAVREMREISSWAGEDARTLAMNAACAMTKCLTCACDSLSLTY